MIVEDHHAVRRGIRALVDGHPSFTVVAEAANGHSAIDENRKTKADIAIVDYSLPGLNGIDLIFRLKQDRPQLEILVYTMHSDPKLVAGLMNAGARAYVMKSDSEDNLLNALNALALGQPYLSGVAAELLIENCTRVARPAPSKFVGVELEIIRLIAEGNTTEEAARMLGVGVGSLTHKRTDLMLKLGLNNVADLVRFAIRNGLVQA